MAVMSVFGSGDVRDTEDYRQLFLQDIPLIDVRSPVEFQQGAFPQAVNLPLLSNTEREAVGTCYKQRGQQQAIELGHQLVSGAVREDRLAAWIAHGQRYPHGYLYCFRGGLRSHTVQQWLREAKLDYPLVIGGYKALRQFLITTLEQLAEYPMTVIGGNTGCGKTLLIKELSAGVDLEGMAHHRGSSFGRTLTEQLPQIDFENRLAITLLKMAHRGDRQWVFEDEGRMIGSNHLPLPLYNRIQQAPLVVIEDPVDQRLARLQSEYIDQMWIAFSHAHGEELGWPRYSDYLYQGLFAIRRRLGLERFQQLAQLLQQALVAQQSGGGSEGHRTWLVPLLQEYYDPMYSYQLSKKTDRIVFRGDYATVKAFLQAQQHRGE